MTRFRVEFEVAVRDDDQEALQKFASDLNHFLGANVPALSGWAKSGQPERIERVPGLLESKPIDPRWTAILLRIEEMIAEGRVQQRRSSALTSGASGAHKGSMFCHVWLYEDRALETKSLYIVSAHEDHRGRMGVTVEGPFDDASDKYWNDMARNDKRNGNAIVTGDWVHRTVSRDDGRARPAHRGHGGAEFKFNLYDKEHAEKLDARGFTVEQADDGEWYLTSHNVWHQGKIPLKHRHLFEINARMVKGFNPSVNL